MVSGDKRLCLSSLSSSRGALVPGESFFLPSSLGGGWEVLSFGSFGSERGSFWCVGFFRFVL